jgi:hypothetical protein
MIRADETWAAVNRLIDRVEDPARLRSHRLHLLAARRWQSLGRDLPADLRENVHLAALTELAVPAIVARVRDAYDGRLLLMKGPVVAAAYPGPTLRPFGDLDLLADDAEAAQRALIDAGFVPFDEPAYYRDIHHLQPLAWPGLPLAIEVHSAPKWPDGMTPPHPRALFAAAAPDGPGGLPCPDPAQHAVLLAAHAWAHGPLRRVGELLDVHVMAAATSPSSTAAVARAWGCERLWRTTEAAAQGLFGAGRRPLSLRLWARHLAGVRERTVIEGHLTTWLSPLGSAPRRPVAAAVDAVGRDLKPADGERWAVKLSRAVRAAASAATPKSDYDLRLPLEERAPVVAAALAEKGQNADGRQA